MSRIEQIEAFIAVVDEAGFSAAAERLGIAKSMVSRRVSELERRLGVQLLQRTTRRQSLTHAGREFYPRASQVIADLDEAEDLVGHAHGRISGRIRLALPLVFGASQLAAPLSRFMREHPKIELDIDLSDRMVDMIADGVDLAIRIGDLEDSNLIARKLAQVHFAVCASPAHLAEHGTPRHPSDLADYEVLVYSNVAVGRQWSWDIDGQRVSPRVRHRLSANNGEFLAAVASHDCGFVAGPLAYLKGFIERGELVPVLEQYPQRVVGMYTVYPPGRLVSRRVKLLSDALYAYFAERDI